MTKKYKNTNIRKSIFNKFIFILFFTNAKAESTEESNWNLDMVKQTTKKGIKKSYGHKLVKWRRNRGFSQ